MKRKGEQATVRLRCCSGAGWQSDADDDAEDDDRDDDDGDEDKENAYCFQC